MPVFSKEVAERYDALLWEIWEGKRKLMPTEIIKRPLEPIRIENVSVNRRDEAIRINRLIVEAKAIKENAAGDLVQRKTVELNKLELLLNLSPGTLYQKIKETPTTVNSESVKPSFSECDRIIYGATR